MRPFHTTANGDDIEGSETRPPTDVIPVSPTTVVADTDYEDSSSDDEVVYISPDERLEDVNNRIRTDEYEYHVLPCVVAGESHICTICMEQLNVGDIQHQLGCGHGFHSRCIKPWLTTQCTYPLCPNCRYDARTGDVSTRAIRRFSVQ